MAKMLPLSLTTPFKTLPPLSGTPHALQARALQQPAAPPPGFAGELATAQARRPAKSQPAAGAAAEDPVAAQKAARDLESVFLNLLWQQMWRTVGQGSNSFFPQGLAGDIYRDFLTQAYADRMAEAGGIGLAELVTRNLRRP